MRPQFTVSKNAFSFYCPKILQNVYFARIVVVYMKKIFIVLFVLLILFFAGAYFLIPGKIVINQGIAVKANADATYRTMLEKNSLHKWWPGDKEPQDLKQISFNGIEYSLEHHLPNLFFVDIGRNNDLINSKFLLIPLSVDSTFLDWKAEEQTSLNPFRRIQQALKARVLKKDMNKILSAFRSFAEKQMNLYGISIAETKVKDSVLVSSKFETDHHPSTQEVYSAIRQLRTYIQTQGAKETDYPMLHVDSANALFTTMVAIPTNKFLEGNHRTIIPKRMVLGNILVTEIKGGPQQIKYASSRLQLFVDDHKKTSPAIPYESLVTDRSRQQDTSQWITKIFYPVL